MNRGEAVEQYYASLRVGKRYYAACVAKGQDPYPTVLNEILEGKPTAGTANIGLVDIPMDRIVGTWADGRKHAFAGNFAPLLDDTTEFAEKWISLCAAHLGDEGITDPISCFEYLGKFYVQEGHKRVSVLKSYGSPTIPGLVTRVIPAPSDDPEIQLYYEFMRFYKASKLYIVSFTRSGSYQKLQAALGFEPDQEWPAPARRSFSTDFRRFSAIFDQLNAADKLPITAGDALLMYLQVHNRPEWRAQSESEVKAALTALWPDIRLMAQGAPVSVTTEPETREKGLLGRILGGPKLHVGFIYDFDPQVSLWAAAHEQGQRYLENKLGNEITVSAYRVQGSADEALEQAEREGVNVFFATGPMMMDACRRLAARNKAVAVFNCSLTQPYTGVRSYYCRIYESKFIAGAIAGAMTAGHQIGYVADYPIMGVPAAVNAFALGARLTNPQARVLLKWSCLPGDPVDELLDAGVTVISNRDENRGVKPRSAWNIGTYQVTPRGDLYPLASPRWNWGTYYERTVRALMAGGIESLRSSDQAVNDWWGLSAGVVEVDADDSLPVGMKHLADILKYGIIDESIDPFRGPVRDQQGALRVAEDGSLTPEELIRMDWLCEHIDGGIPAFEELLPQSQALVRLLGLHRETIPPLTEELKL